MINVADRLKLVSKLRDGSPESQKYIAKMLLGYEVIAEAFIADKDIKGILQAVHKEKQLDIVRGNRATFNVLCDKDMIPVLKLMIDNPEFRKGCKNNPKLLELFTGNGLAVRFNVVAGECCLDTESLKNLQNISDAIKVFNIESVAEQTDEERELAEFLGEEDYEDGTEQYSEDEKALRELLMSDAELADSFSHSGKGTEDIQFDPELLENMKAGAKDTSVITEDANEYEKENEEDIKLSSSELDEISDMIASITSRNEAVFRSCMEMDRPFGMLYAKGMARCEIENGKLKYIAGMAKGGRSTFEVLYSKITGRYQNQLICANDLRNTPTSENISSLGYTYYPGYVFQYAFGCVSNSTFNNWNTFSKALRAEVTKRLKILYKKDLFYDFKDRIEMAFTNALLVLDYDRGGGMKIRMCLTGTPINCSQMEADIKSIPTYANASVNVRQVNGMVDVVDIQIIMNEKQFLSRPSWAYQAMAVKINSGEPLDLDAGIPIGRKIDGDFVNLTFKPSEDFVTLICAGSGAGKGVLTLSILGAALGNGLPVFYADYKPDMACIFWELEEKLGIHTFSIDGLTGKSRKDVNGKVFEPGHNIPDGLKTLMKQYAGTLTYIKTIQFMCALAKRRTDVGFSGNLLFIFDEIQAAQKVVKAMMSSVYSEMKACKPKSKETPSDKYLYLKAVADMVKDADVGITTYLNTTGRASGLFTTFIGQSPNWDVWSGSSIASNGDYPKMDLLGQITKAGTVRKLIGKGASSSKYGLSSLAKNDPASKKYVEENRFFGMYTGNTCEGADVTVFKPFLTLNTDDIKHKCWTNGIGREFGYKGNKPEDFERYRKNVAAVHPGDNQYGVHKGTGFLGLTGMYCNQDIERIKTALESSYKVAMQFMEETGLADRYSSVEEMLYDLSDEGLLTIEAMVNYRDYKAAVTGEDGEGQSSEETVLTDIKYDRDEDEGEEPIDFGTSFGKTADVAATSENVLNKPLGRTFSIENDPTLLREIQGEAAQEIHHNPLEDELNKLKEELFTTEFGDEEGDEDLFKEGFDDELTEPAENTGNTGSNGDKRPICVNSTEQIMGFIDKLEKLIQLNIEGQRGAYVLNKDNSIDCTRCHGGAKSWRDSIFLKTPKGQDKMTTLLWKDILDTIEAQGFKGATVTRLSIYGDKLYINGKLVNLNGVLGGTMDLRLQDIVQIKTTLNRFKYIREMRLDDVIMDSVQLELGENALQELFRLEQNLIKLSIEHNNGTYTQVTRQDILEHQNSLARQAMEQKMAERRARMAIDAECKARNVDKRGTRGVGYDISMNKLAKASFGNASEHLMNSSKPSLIKGLGWGAVGFATGALAVAGGLLSGGYKALKSLTEVGK